MRMYLEHLRTKRHKNKNGHSLPHACSDISPSRNWRSLCFDASLGLILQRCALVASYTGVKGRRCRPLKHASWVQIAGLMAPRQVGRTSGTAVGGCGHWRYFRWPQLYCRFAYGDSGVGGRPTLLLRCYQQQLHKGETHSPSFLCTGKQRREISGVRGRDGVGIYR